MTIQDDNHWWVSNIIPKKTKKFEFENLAIVAYEIIGILFWNSSLSL